MYNFFIERVRANLHVVLAMSPIGDAFRSRMRMFPSLINCCTIDWFQVSLCPSAKHVYAFLNRSKKENKSLLKTVDNNGKIVFRSPTRRLFVRC